ncbi:3-oxoacyl-[acyl-carrier protein] reductase [Trinickia symbiotica]|uniref:SDR family oxidoreductase n=1 Tax=Trinickia symbiotica TaxID=863227 RepID=A0A2N7WL58_9BURK|nr:SDR family oxidoreductase [Trinickia symbiotica]PMS30104.1 SDR family oxidoreductase [Trinickia symbiotica]PPK41098.1 3-oxoacyl-[acyl-carrier protein] reductase [Trinickia symbiotica]
MHAPELRNRVALITGAGRGIGQSLARSFVDAGMRVTLCDVHEESIHAMEADLGADRTIAIPTDVSDYASCQASVSQTVARFGHLDVLVNNAALGAASLHADYMTRGATIDEIPAELWTRIISVNLNGPFYMTKAAVPRMRAQQFGRVVNIGTSFFTMLRPGFSPYGPSKAGMEAWSTGMAKELASDGITINVVVPGGPVATQMIPNPETIDQSQFVPAERMAAPILYLVSDAGGSISGMRFVAAQWDDSLPIAQRIAASGTPSGWPELANKTNWTAGELQRKV